MPTAIRNSVSQYDWLFSHLDIVRLGIVAKVTEDNQTIERIRTELTPTDQMMDLQTMLRSASEEGVAT